MMVKAIMIELVGSYWPSTSRVVFRAYSLLLGEGIRHCFQLVHNDGNGYFDMSIGWLPLLLIQHSASLLL